MKIGEQNFWCTGGQFRFWNTRADCWGRVVLFVGAQWRTARRQWCWLAVSWFCWQNNGGVSWTELLKLEVGWNRPARYRTKVVGPYCKLARPVEYWKLLGWVAWKILWTVVNWKHSLFLLLVKNVVNVSLVSFFALFVS